ncbi:MAG: hypothetical protein QOC96_386 [Acidobacteriota bacterium]|nr:hypothetical protein [Acidobacteriota bacterium]
MNALLRDTSNYGSFHETQEALDHENAATTRVYVQRITVKTDKHSSKVAQRMKRTPLVP